MAIFDLKKIKYINFKIFLTTYFIHLTNVKLIFLAL